jgi:16S rRNA (uracil1498-N3)-methyltransferase
MTSADRYFWDAPDVGGIASLTGQEAHHLIHVMRGATGTRVVLFDGRGCEFLAEIDRIERGKVHLSILAHHEVDRELPFSLTVAVALPKGDRQKWLVEKAVELGVARLVPLKTSRSVAQPVQQAVVRLERTVIEASKQCGRNWLMEISEPQSWPDFVTNTQEMPARLLAHPGDRSRPSGLADGLRGPSDKTVADPVVLAVGPEGGFTAEEVALAVAAGWTLVDLGPRILRVETAAILLAAMVTGLGRSW